MFGIPHYITSMREKWIRGAIPALLIHCSIGSVYCWSLFSREIATCIGFSIGAIEWAFSLAIFFLGMSAAFFGKLVERDIRKSSILSTCTFVLGLLGTGVCIQIGSMHPGSILALIGVYICYGCIMGIGLGVGYLTPVKTLMLWFKDQKGLATGLAVAGFGLAKAIASPIMQSLLQSVGVYTMLYIFAGVYCVCMIAGSILLKKPDSWVEPSTTKNAITVKQSLKKQPWQVYVGLWLVFYLNITSGLAIISQEKLIMQSVGAGALAGLVATLASISNAGGRIGYSALSDRGDDRLGVFPVIFIMGAVVAELACYFWWPPVLIVAICIINAGYGGGFSIIAPMLSDIYGMDNISAIHGLTLTAWAAAGLSGNQLATHILAQTGSLANVFMVVATICVLAYFIYVGMVVRKLREKA